MTYALQAKNELVRHNLGNNCCRRAELTAFIHLGGNLQLSGRKLSLNVVTSHAAVARRVFSLFRQTFKLAVPEVLVRKKFRLRKNNAYLVRINDSPKLRELVEQLGLLHEDKTTALQAGDRCCRRSYLRAAFLIAGSLSNPENSYHLEIYTDYLHQAEELAALMLAFGLTPKTIKRKNGFLVYLKESDQIGVFLNIIGAHTTLFGFENIRILKSMRNRINRLVNFETANVNKTVEAALKQMEAIQYLCRLRGLASLTPPLRSLAELRLAHPEASLQELGEMMSPPLGKSGVNHRMRKLVKTAAALAHKESGGQDSVRRGANHKTKGKQQG
ncbi:MAG: Sporulation transcription regulator WhiA [Syntrophomonadaceae bacterium]|nr:Sporulation transcription regulator WhiA [Bacillota bacterium]